MRYQKYIFKKNINIKVMEILMLRSAQMSGKKFKKDEIIDAHPAVASAWLKAKPPIAKVYKKKVKM